MIAKCSCQFCGVNIEFDTKEYLSGDTIVCPKCGLETILSVSEKTAPPKPDTFVLDIRLNSGVELRITTIRLYEEQAVAKLNAKKAEAVKLLQGVSTGIGAIGSVEWVLAASAIIGAAEAALSSGASSAGIQLLEEAIQLERRLFRNGAYVAVNQIQEIEVPLPSLWKGVRSRKFDVAVQVSTDTRKDLQQGSPTLIHDGGDFVSVTIDDGSVCSIRWSSVESFNYRKL